MHYSLIAAGLTPENEKAFRKLAAVLLEPLPGEFDMEEYRKTDMEYADGTKFKAALYVDPDYRTTPACGTIACAMGWSPILVEPAIRGETWDEYSKRVYGVWQSNMLDPDSPREIVWKFCFHPNWVMIDNTAEGAAKRILYMLEHGVPKELKVLSLIKMNSLRTLRESLLAYQKGA